ncbi:SH3 domain-containing protein [Mesorhizobium atlanticum]
MASPLEIYQEYGNWRRVRDWDGSTGWIYHSLLSGRRTGIVAPWSKITLLCTPSRQRTAPSLPGLSRALKSG